MKTERDAHAALLDAARERETFSKALVKLSTSKPLPKRDKKTLHLLHPLKRIFGYEKL